MKWFLIRALVASAALVPWGSSTPVARDGVVKTTTRLDGQMIDWVVLESQGDIASPPPDALFRRGVKQPPLEAIIHLESAMDGPPGTVPVLRGGGPTLPKKRLPDAADNNSVAVTGESFAGKHWYASAGQQVGNWGGKATFSLFNAFAQRSSDFSLLQMAVIRPQAAHAGTGPVTQTVEAGWINYPNQVRPPHLFAYYTTNGYAGDGDGIGGWNRDGAGWVQTDATIYPGVAFTPLSANGGAQYEVDIGFLLHAGNWWLWVLDRYIGYYPGHLFARGVHADDTLAGRSTLLDFYGEVFNSGPDLTSTDMGSGEFPDGGFGRSAYLHNMVHVDAAGKSHDYDGSGQIIVSDPGRYRILSFFRSSTTWRSYVFVGGPGAGGVVGG
ncbi:hypothetical protein CDD82_4645 [Ophiocordyceps australis]|uniref:Neprosin PEP catalytic domain-containing protein n=1 Tax=Ophiocordyceps australis TaxID=1399860 RepID=A0A2C5Z5A0_9HYPO|nr:hypothetical protein CDD82_4645 [Ophiocordyceps australis]